jgi:hypothetical protein
VAQGILPFAPDLGGLHRVGRPEQLEHVGVVDQPAQLCVPVLAGAQPHDVAQVLVAERGRQQLELADDFGVAV